MNRSTACNQENLLDSAAIHPLSTGPRISPNPNASFAPTPHQPRRLQSRTISPSSTTKRQARTLLRQRHAPRSEQEIEARRGRAGRGRRFLEKASRCASKAAVFVKRGNPGGRHEQQQQQDTHSPIPMGSRSRGGSGSGRRLLLFPFLLLLLHLLSLRCPSVVVSAAGSGDPYVGVTIGTQVMNLLSPSDLASFLRAQRITRVRLYDADPRLLSALAASGSGVRAIVGVPNDELLALGSSPATAASWVSRRVLPFAGVNSSTPNIISAIAVGDEVPTALPSALPVLLPAIQSLAAALAAANLSSIPVSTPLPFSVVLDPFPPSQAFFNNSLAKSFVAPLLAHLANTSAPLMLNLYPYYSLMQSKGVIPLDNALFRPLPPSQEMVDPNTLLHYTNVFDAMLDAVRVAVRNLNATGGATMPPILVTETGWPSYGDRRSEPYATRDNADAYNSNLIKHVLEDRPGTPMAPGAGAQSSAYIYELFNEDLRPGPVSEANWGLFYGNGTPVYLLHVSGADGFLGNDTTDRTFCVAADDADEKAVQAAMDWACGPGRADCTAIQPGQPCYQPDDVRSHASFAFDAYYQSQGRAAGSCYFQGAGMVTTVDPSHDSCLFPGSKLLGNSTGSGSTNTSTRPTSDAGGSAIWRLRTGREKGFLLFLRLVLSIAVVIVIFELLDMTRGC